MKPLKSVFKNPKEEIRFHPVGRVQLFLREYMDNNGITRNALSSYSDVDYKTVSRYYKNENVQNVDLNLLAKFCYCMGCDLPDIMRYIPPNNK